MTTKGGARIGAGRKPKRGETTEPIVTRIKRSNREWLMQTAAKQGKDTGELIDSALENLALVHQTDHGINLDESCHPEPDRVPDTSGAPAEGQYQVIYVTPDYSQSLAELKSILDLQLVAPAATLFLWALDEKLDTGMCLGQSWGFKYQSSFIWDKRYDTQGPYHQQNHAHLLIFNKGNHYPVAKNPGVGSIITREAPTFDKKPEVFRDSLVAELYEGLEILELK